MKKFSFHKRVPSQKPEQSAAEQGAEKQLKDQSGQDAPENQAGEALAEPAQGATEQTSPPNGPDGILTEPLEKRTKRRPKGKMSKKKKAILASLLALLVVGVSCAGAYVHAILYNPKSVLDNTDSIKSSYDELLSQADQDLLSEKIINVLVVGVDYAEERETWRGKHAYHADVMIVLAINLEKNTVDMISLPRDTYAKIPGVAGKYKLNASLDCGGGYPEGLTKVCEAASWMLGGMPISYYYAVTMPVLKDLVNAVDGLDYNVDLDFSMAGRKYTKGKQHMDGQAVLDYLRVRKHVEEAGDLNRINRQKNLLVELFKKMKNSNLIVKIPSIVSAFNGKLITNASLSKTAALAAFAYKLPPENIKMHSMGGPMYNIYNWNFCLTNQKQRVSLIKEVYGVTVSEYVEYSPNYCRKEWSDMRAKVYIPTAEALLAYAKKQLEADGAFATPTPSPAAPTPSHTPATTTPTPATPSHTPTTTPSESPSTAPSSGSRAVATTGKYSEAVKAQYQNTVAAMEQLQKAKKAASAKTPSNALLKDYETALTNLQSQCNTLAEQMGYKQLKWVVTYENQIKVDFR